MAASGGAGGLGGAQAVDVAQVQAAAAKADAQEVVASQEQSDISMIRDSQDLTNPQAATRTRKKEEKFQTLESRRKGAAQTEKNLKVLAINLMQILLINIPKTMQKFQAKIYAVSEILYMMILLKKTS